MGQVPVLLKRMPSLQDTEIPWVSYLTLTGILGVRVRVKEALMRKKLWKQPRAIASRTYGHCEPLWWPLCLFANTIEHKEWENWTQMPVFLRVRAYWKSEIEMWPALSYTLQEGFMELRFGPWLCSLELVTGFPLWEIPPSMCESWSCPWDWYSLLFIHSRVGEGSVISGCSKKSQRLFRDLSITCEQFWSARAWAGVRIPILNSY